MPYRVLEKIILRPASYYSDDEPELYPPTEEEKREREESRRRWNDRYVAVVSATEK